ncbi:hypothetical protein DERF_014924 [Dermatophagoides farinae]|uniref:Uncharacterized protein n=1 Tax=Dermatophagoides farinae TaxID=6954 RepID=A0A922HQ00_DERFA|nr:hypothetical protein DERF_014924 [Dermatophagoides farinae]
MFSNFFFKLINVVGTCLNGKKINLMMMKTAQKNNKFFCLRATKSLGTNTHTPTQKLPISTKFSNSNTSSNLLFFDKFRKISAMFIDLTFIHSLDWDSSRYMDFGTTGDGGGCTVSKDFAVQ